MTEEQVREEVEKLRAITDRELAKLVKFYTEQTQLLLERLGLPSKPDIFNKMQSFCDYCRLISADDVDTIVEELLELQECQNI